MIADQTPPAPGAPRAGGVITSAGALWRRWETDGVVRAKDYERDLTELILTRVGAPPSDWAKAGEHMDAVQWGPRELIHAIHPALASFSGMLADLLALYRRVDAQRTDAEPLRISYAFADGDAIDDGLRAFAETVERVQRVTRQAFGLDYPENAWHGPLEEEAVRSRTGLDLGPSHDTPFPGEIAAPSWLDDTGVAARIREVGQLHLRVLALVLTTYRRYGDDVDDLFAAYMALPEDEQQERAPLFFDATDFWLPRQRMLLKRMPDVLAGMEPADAAALLDAQEAWLESFLVARTETVDELVSEVTDVLRLPHWGKRHDLYATWVTACMDSALDGRLRFDVTDGVLAFPFSPRRIATLSTTRGEVALWSEQRHDASGPLGGGRVRGIQPDYSFIDEDGHVIVAVEAKQYLRAVSKNPGEAARDYARTLTGAEVFIVAHGPLGPTTLGKVEGVDRARVQLHRDVRPRHPGPRERFQDALARCLPKPLPRPYAPAVPTTAPIPAGAEVIGVVELHWDAEVYDLDLHLISEGTGVDVTHDRRNAAHAHLQADAFHGGPERAALLRDGAAVRIEVHLYSADTGSVAAAAPCVTVTTTKAVLALVPAAGGADSGVWRVARVAPDGRVTLLDAGPEHSPPSAARR